MYAVKIVTESSVENNRGFVYDYRENNRDEWGEVGNPSQLFDTLERAQLVYDWISAVWDDIEYKIVKVEVSDV